MNVDVLYRGLELAKNVAVREENGGTFVELEAPMPVGSQVVIRTADQDREARVERVHEGTSAGMLIRYLDATKVASEEPKGNDSAAPEESEEGSRKGGRKDRRSRPRKTFIGH